MRPLAAVASVLLVAGCAAPPPSALFQAEASSAHTYEGYDYQGRTAQRGNGTAVIEVDAARDEGRAEFTFERDGRDWRVVVDRFVANESWQEGGVRTDFVFRGATGVGDAALPRMHALAAGWGSARAWVDGALVEDPATGNATLEAAFVVTDTAPRNLSTDRVLRASGAVFHPRSPEQGRTEPRLQMLLDLRSAAPAPPADYRIAMGFRVNEPLHRNVLPFPVVAERGHLNLTWLVLRPPNTVPAASLDFFLSGPGGEALAAWHYDPTVALSGSGPGPPRFDLALAPPLAVGNYTMRVEGDGVGAEYNLIAAVDYAQPIFHHVVYADVRLGP